MSRVPGHALRGEGAAHNADGKRIWPPVKGQLGHGRCQCGELSPAVLTNAQRKRWHADHKKQIQFGRALSTITETSDDGGGDGDDGGR
jgi:hypothetical protein